MSRRSASLLPITLALLLFVGVTLVFAYETPKNGDQAEVLSDPSAPAVSVGDAQEASPPVLAEPLGENVAQPQDPQAPAAPCTGSGPSVPGPVTLDQCYGRSFTVGGNPRTISVWYITDTTVYNVDGKQYEHWILNEAQAEDVADAVEESWQAVFSHSNIGGTNHEPYINGCGNNLNIQMEDGKGWSGIAYWGSSGNCSIGIDAPMVRNGVGTGDDGVIFHEVQHYTQYSYDNGCYNDFRPLYPGNSWIEGWANWAGKNATNAASDASYSVSSYNASKSYYDLSYTNLHQGYLIQQYGGNGAPADPPFGINAVYEHYRRCDQYDDLFVTDETIQALTGGAKSEKWAFVDFLAAYYAYPYADPVTQPELVFPDADDKPTGQPTYSQDVSMSGGSQSWVESTPDDWAGRYYRIRPQSGCEFVQLHVETSPPGGEVGINFMGVDTSAPTQVLRSATIGDEATRFYAGAGSLDELIVIVNAFDTAATTYEVEATCVAPSIEILEPLQNPGHAMVGDPSSPIATLTRFEVSGPGGLAISGIVSTEMSFDAEGDAATVVPGTYQEVGPGEYWAVINPPSKPASTTWADYQVCLLGSFCDSETDALLYVDPGNTDVALAIDESGSMDTEDTPGEGKRYVNAKKAAKVVANLLRDGDRITVLGFGGEDDPPGCGLPPDGTGTGNCDNANITHLPRTDVTVPGTIGAALSAIDNVSARPVWTNIGQALLDAKNLLLANPGNTNPDFIYLLSDGRENVLPLYADAKAELQASGVNINTIGFGPEAPGALLAQIAAENGGIYRPVATSGLGVVAASSVVEDARASALALGVPEPLASQLAIAAAPFLPGQLTLANAYDILDTESQDAARLFHTVWTASTDNMWQEWTTQVDKSASTLRFVVAGKQEDSDVCEGFHRDVEILPPGAGQREWVPISPPSSDFPPPANWDIRNETYNDVLIVKNPEPGEWSIRAKYYYLVCLRGEADEEATAEAIALSPDQFESDFIMNASVQSTVHLEGRLLGLDHGQGMAGDVVPIVATLMTKDGTIPGALVVVQVENIDGAHLRLLFDDGMHHDGGPNDGIYGWDYAMTPFGGSYGVRIAALFPDPVDPTTNLIREWNGGFWMKGSEEDDNVDDDNMPSWWEERFPCLDPRAYDAQTDPDHDGLVSYDEFLRGLNPCRPDTDRGGEIDGSEVKGGRDPLLPNDDLVRPVGHVELRPLDERIWIKWTRPLSYTRMLVHVSTDPDQLGQSTDMGQRGEFTLTGLNNGQAYYLTLQGENDDAQGAYSDQFEIVPKADPVPPQGAFFIGGPNVTDGGDTASSRFVTLFVDATDLLSYLGPASHSVGHSALNPRLIPFIQPSGDVEMRFANDPVALESATWEPLADEKAWALDCGAGEICVVFGQFRDGAANESLVVTDEILLQEELLYLPFIFK
jgi:hypothetical protein